MISLVFPVGRIEVTNVQGRMPRRFDVDFALRANFLPVDCFGICVQHRAKLVTQADREEGGTISIIEYQHHETTATARAQNFTLADPPMPPVEAGSSTRAQLNGWRWASVCFLYCALVSRRANPSPYSS